MIRAWIVSLGVSLALTLIIELIFSLLCRKRGRALVFVTLANILTNPAVVLGALLWRHFGLPCFWLYTAAAEILAVLAEGAVYKKSREGFSRPYLFSLAANGLSFTLGHLLQTIF